MMADPTQRRRNAEATREALLEAARTLLAERGATQTTTRDIAAVVGVNQALINRYFGSKENLFVEAVRTGGSGAAGLVASTPLADLPDKILREVLDVSASGGGSTALLAGVVNNETINDLIRSIIEDVFTRQLGDRLGGDSGGLRAELLNALVVGITIMRHKIESPALSQASMDEISDYVTRMAAPLLTDDR
ncbi:MULTISPECIES: TetR/AcrR family transcriptional regulator [Gordonia]|uniref:TetR family transcriptional regulator n=1 Tax=Gordonia amicalis TaxID=89053 RepID=A0AAE4QZM7_9ACTN|nr:MULTISPECIES: TetR/AcrR family transcriptional regulator [Gordonia]ATD70800.1 TetR family transcriptional regulator [Gordonia sp. 1D]MCZ0913275.1 TetR family transcriptional regulator [Gordonia amicalis]MCZ4577844.1 TetR family transcriptional regulator [Gordonia amicalis]MCZ4652464.1 TetR family transcriptional regulator [Gordonia amicalis]MDJ0451161.1 TetR family transcriptional regulator [Gordonia amicalis]